MKTKHQTIVHQQPAPQSATCNAASQNLKPAQHVQERIEEFINQQFHNGIYWDTLEQAVANLYEAGFNSDVLFDATTGKPTEQGEANIATSVEDASDKYLDLARDGFYETEQMLSLLLSDRAVLNFLMAQAANRDDLKKPQAGRQAAQIG